MIKFIPVCEETLNIDCVGWDGYGGKDEVSLGGITKNNDDGYYWFFASREQIPLSSNQMKIISDKLAALNK